MAKRSSKAATPAPVNVIDLAEWLLKVDPAEQFRRDARACRADAARLRGEAKDCERILSGVDPNDDAALDQIAESATEIAAECRARIDDFAAKRAVNLNERRDPIDAALVTLRGMEQRMAARDAARREEPAPKLRKRAPKSDVDTLVKAMVVLDKIRDDEAFHALGQAMCRHYGAGSDILADAMRRNFKGEIAQIKAHLETTAST